MRTQINDSIRLAETIRNIGIVHRNLINYDSARHYYDSSWKISKRYNSTELRLSYYIHGGELYAVQGDYIKAIGLYSRALDLLKTHDYKVYFALIYLRIAQIYDAQGDFQRALEHFFKSYDIEAGLGNRQHMGRLEGFIGWTYLNQGNDSTAFVHARNSLEATGKINDREGIAYANNLMGYIYYKRKNYDLALKYYLLTIVLREELKSKLGIAFTTYNIARLYESKGATDKGIEYGEKALAVFQELNNKPAVLLAFNMLGNLYIKNKNYQKAYASLEQARLLSLQLPSAVRLRDCYKGFTRYYRAKGDAAKTIYYYDKLVQLNDSVFSHQSNVSKEQLVALYQVEQKEKEIKTLQQQNSLHQTQILLQRSKIKWQDGLLTFTLIVIFMLLVLAFMLLKYYRTKSRANQSLEKLYREITEQKEEIQAQSEELVEANQALRDLNYNILEKQEEIQAQSEELREANEMIGNVNRNLEKIVSKRTLQLSEAYKELDTFFYRSSHDFRRPLTTFLGLAEVANITVKDKNALELFAKVKETAINLDKMLTKLQSISDVGTNQLIYKEVLLREIFDGICMSFQSELQKKNIKIGFEMRKPVSFFSYPAMVKLILENLIENSIHFSGLDDPFIKLVVSEVNDEIVLDFLDNGQGVEEEYKSRVFDMYFRANERSKGNGLGLYIVKKAVEKLDGSIMLNSTILMGTTFTIKLPCKPANAKD
jgi:signal transduction histidine kinase